MANRPHAFFRFGSIVWALVLGGIVLFLGASILLPSTKRARIDFNQLRAEHEAAERDSAATQAASQPTTKPSSTSNE